MNKSAVMKCTNIHNKSDILIISCVKDQHLIIPQNSEMDKHHVD